MGFLRSVKKSVKGYLDKRNEEREYQRQLNQEARDIERKEYEKAFRESAAEAARIRAKERAAKATGLAKLRAVSQMHKSAPAKQGGLLQQLKEYTEANKLRREQALKRTEAIRRTAKQIREEQMATRRAVRDTKPRPFGYYNVNRRDRPPLY